MKTVALGEIANINPRLGRTMASDEPVSFVPMAYLSDQSAAATPESVRPFGEVAKGYTPMLDGDLLVAKITPCFENGKIGQAQLTTRVGMGSTEFHVVRPSAEIDARYLLHFLRTPRVNQAGRLRMTGSGGQRRVPAAYLEELGVPLPPLDEQRRIAAILDCAADLKRANARIESAVRELVSREFERRFPVGVSGRPFGAYVSDLVGGRNLVADDQAADAPFRVLKISAVTSGVFLEGESKPLPRSYSPPESHLVRSGDLLISRANTAELVGASALVVTDRTDLVLPDKLWRIVWREPDAIRPRYALALLQSQPVRRAMTRLASGTGGSMKNISKAKLLAMPISIAPLADQQRFEELADAASLHLTLTRARQRRLDTQMRTLPTRAFTGGL